MKTTKKHFEYFKDRCELWMEVLSLQSWRVRYKHEKIAKDALADCSTNYTGHVATIRLDTNWGDLKVTEKELDESALHEVLELLFDSMFSLASARVWEEEVFTKEHHTVIRTITHLLLAKREEK